MKKVTIYSTAACTWCKTAKDFFKQHNIEFTEHNVGNDLEKRKEMIELSGQKGVPVTTVGDEVIVGFDKEKLEKALDITK